jgi:hypothetical protein
VKKEKMEIYRMGEKEKERGREGGRKRERERERERDFKGTKQI